LEADAALIERWLQLPTMREELVAAGLGRDADTVRTATAAFAAATQRLADGAFNNFLDLIGRPNRRLVLPSRGMPLRARR
jgi:GMP synthase (glutamine-hydrolysing)